jgi:Flp pilus assembly protein CpaB
VAISVTGAEALGVMATDPAGERVDVIVTSEPGPAGGRGRTRIEATGVPLLALAEGGGGGYAGSSGGGQTATLALTKPQALRLIEAENFARQVRLIPH